MSAMYERRHYSLLEKLYLMQLGAMRWEQVFTKIEERMRQIKAEREADECAEKV